VSVRALDDPREFLDLAGPLLLADEARNNLPLGICGTILDLPGRYPEKCFWVVLGGHEPVAAALRTPPYNLVLAAPRDDAALEELAAGIDAELPGLVGAHPEVDRFAEAWCRPRGLEHEVLRDQGVYSLDRVQPVPAAPGSWRDATRDDEALLVDWFVAFATEVLEEDDPGRDEAKHGVSERLGARDGGFAIWEDEGRPVSMSGWGGPTPNGIRIGPVYTPPELRGRGYATSLVAEQSQWLLDSGRAFCFLFTDMANPTSNAIYRRIGYAQVAESAMVAFSRP
jgi:predicted GNAT family acetyltransferase